MSGIWPNCDLSDLESIVRTYLNESTVKFYLQNEIYKWLSYMSDEIAQKTFCIKRFLDTYTNANERLVEVKAIKVLYVEYIPSSGRSIMLKQIDPLKLGNHPTKGSMPQFWYEYGTGIHIEPVPNAIYALRLYVVDDHKTIESISNFTTGTGADEWTAGTGWSSGNPIVHTGGSSNLTYNTALEEKEYTLEFLITDVGTNGTITPYIGVKAGSAVTKTGYYCQIILGAGGNPVLKFVGENDIAINNITLYKKKDFSSSSDRTSLSVPFQHTLSLLATAKGLKKDKQFPAANLLESICANELLYLKQNIVDIIPDSRNSLRNR